MIMTEAEKKALEKEAKEQYEKVVKNPKFREWHPRCIGEWEHDKIYWIAQIKELHRQVGRLNNQGANLKLNRD